MRSVLIVLGLLIYSSCFSQENQERLCICCGSDYDNFDFWLGDWVVFDTLGNEIGSNKVVELQDGCALQENWTSANSTGTSYNYFNKTDSTWNQVWIDNQGGSLVLKGERENVAMVMRSELVEGTKVPFYMNEIVWTPRKDGTVSQVWNIRDEEGKLLNTVFYGIYKRWDK